MSIILKLVFASMLLTAGATLASAHTGGNELAGRHCQEAERFGACTEVSALVRARSRPWPSAKSLSIALPLDRVACA